MVKCKTVDLEVPAQAQIVLEGYVEPGERRREGPFGDHTGLYSLADAFRGVNLACPRAPHTRRVQMVTGPVDELEDAAVMPAFGGKMGVDATRKGPSEGQHREWPKRL